MIIADFSRGGNDESTARPAAPGRGVLTSMAREAQPRTTPGIVDKALIN